MADRRFVKQDIDNQGADRLFDGFPMRELVGYDADAGVLRRIKVDSTGALSTVDAVAQKITTVGSVTYIAVAVPGTAQSTAKWQVKKIDTTTGTVITWADGNANFDNVATDLTALAYS